MAVAFASPIDLTGLELLNARIQNVAILPAAGSEGRVVHLTTDHKLYLDNGTSWVDLTAQGAVYTAGTGLTLTGGAFAADFGTTAGKVAQGNDPRFTDSRTPTGSAGGDLSGTYPNPQIAAGAIVNADVSASAAIAQSKVANLTTDLAAKAPSANPTFTGTVTVPNGAVSGAAVNLGQLQAVQEGTKAKSARVVSTVNVNVSSPGASHGGESLSNGDIILLVAQSTASQNGPYRYNGASNALTRDPNADTWDELVGARWLIEEGTSKGTRWYSGAEAGGTIGTTALSIIPAPGLDHLVAGAGLTKSGNTLNFTGKFPGSSTEIWEFGPVAQIQFAHEGLTGHPQITFGGWNGIDFNGIPIAGIGAPVASDSPARRQDAGRTIKGDVTAGTETTVTHNWGTRDVQVEVFRNSGNYDTVLCEVQRTSTNAVKLVFGTAATAGEYRYVIREIA